MSEAIIDLLERVVERTWKEEIAFSKSLFKRIPKKDESMCQGISRGVFHKVFGCFPDSYMVNFKVDGKEHIVVHVSNLLEDYIIDGTIKQFLKGENNTVFRKRNYPFFKELQKAERWHS